MSIRTEWAHAAQCQPEYTHHTDAYGTESDGPALLLGSDSVLAIEGTPAEMLELLDRCRRTIEEARR